MKYLNVWQRQLAGVIFAVLIIFSLGSCVEKTHELILLHTNDSHGSILPVDGLGGMAERAAYIEMIRKENPAVLLVDAGDINTGQAISNMYSARPDIEAYNYMGYDAITVGNHEFDKPVDTLLLQMRLAQFPFIISNVEKDGNVLGKEYLIKEINGVKVGIFGLVTKNTANVSIYAKDLAFTDEVQTARKMVKLLRDQKADVVIGLVHLGFTESTPDFITSYKLAEQVGGIDILVDGHSHSYIEKPERVNNTWIVTANQSGRYVGMGNMKVKGGHLMDFDWKPVQIKGIRPDSILVKKLAPYVEGADKDLSTVLGEATAEFNLYEDGINMVRYKEMALGDLIADALVWKANGLKLKADFGLTNSGGIRESLPAGKVTKGSILAILPFANELEIMTMKGSSVLQLFDFLAGMELGNGAFAQVSKEVQVVYDHKAKKLVSLKIGGQPVAEDKVYYMATCDYVAAGKDGYDQGLGEIINREKTSRLLSDVVMEYIQGQKIITPRTDGRIRFEQ